jgi:hypothetical protein
MRIEGSNISLVERMRRNMTIHIVSSKFSKKIYTQFSYSELFTCVEERYIAEEMVLC